MKKEHCDLKVATCFSGGFGSIELALKYDKTPHEIVFACEWLEPQRKSYLLNHGEPTSKFYKDIKDLDGKKYKGKIDLLHLSPPCQSYSIAGNRLGLQDDKGGLMYEAIRVIDEVQPKIFTIENVRGLLSSNGGDDWKNILKDINSLRGYSISWGIMNAKHQGTPQNRERVFIVGFRANLGMMAFPGKVPLAKKLYDLLEVDVLEKYFLSKKMINSFIKKDKETSFKFKPLNRNSDPCIKEELIVLGHVSNSDSQANRVYSPVGIAPSQSALGGGGGAKTGLFLVKANTKKGFEEVGGNDTLNLSFPSSKTRGGRVRRLTPLECAKIQGDFENIFKHGDFSDTKLYEFIGNAMDINTTRRLLKCIFNHSKNAIWNEPQSPSFERSSPLTQTTLF